MRRNKRRKRIVGDSVAYRFAFEIKSAQAFLKKILRPHDDLALIVGFNQQPTMVSPPTSDVSRLSRALRGMKPGGETALYDAVAFASDRLQEMPSSGPVRHVIVLSLTGRRTAATSVWMRPYNTQYWPSL